MLATFFPLPTLTFLGDVPPPTVPAGAPWWAHYAIAAAPAVGFWLFSTLVGELNAYVRKCDATAVPVSPRLRLVASLLNGIAGNLDKSREQRAIASGAAAPRPAPEKPEVTP